MRSSIRLSELVQVVCRKALNQQLRSEMQRVRNMAESEQAIKRSTFVAREAVDD